MRASTAGLTGTAAELNALVLGARKPGVDAFTDHLALELGEDAAHLEHGTAGGCRGVDRLLMQVEIALQRLQLHEETGAARPR